MNWNAKEIPADVTSFSMAVQPESRLLFFTWRGMTFKLRKLEKTSDAPYWLKHSGRCLIHECLNTHLPDEAIAAATLILDANAPRLIRKKVKYLKGSRKGGPTPPTYKSGIVQNVARWAFRFIWNGSRYTCFKRKDSEFAPYYFHWQVDGRRFKRRLETCDPVKAAELSVSLMGGDPQANPPVVQGEEWPDVIVASTC